MLLEGELRGLRLSISSPMLQAWRSFVSDKRAEAWEETWMN